MAARHFLVLSDKETKQRKRFNRTTLSVHSVQFLFIGAPKARCSPERRMFETLLLANPDIDTLRHRCSRASTSCQETCSASRIFAASFPGWLAVVRYAYKFGNRLSADSAGCPLGRFNHWWRSESEPVFGERGVHTSVVLASTVLLGHL